MFEKIIMVLFDKRSLSSVTTISRNNRVITEEVLKEKPLASSGIYASFGERENFYQKMFSVCNQR